MAIAYFIALSTALLCVGATGLAPVLSQVYPSHSIISNPRLLSGQNVSETDFITVHDAAKLGYTLPMRFTVHGDVLVNPNYHFHCYATGMGCCRRCAMLSSSALTCIAPPTVCTGRTRNPHSL